MKRLLSARQRKLKEERRRRGNTCSEVKAIEIKTEFTPLTAFTMDADEVFLKIKPKAENLTGTIVEPSPIEEYASKDAEMILKLTLKPTVIIDATAGDGSTVSGV